MIPFFSREATQMKQSLLPYSLPIQQDPQQMVFLRWERLHNWVASLEKKGIILMVQNWETPHLILLERTIPCNRKLLMEVQKNMVVALKQRVHNLLLLKIFLLILMKK